jgi:hypothetical protein
MWRRKERTLPEAAIRDEGTTARFCRVAPPPHRATPQDAAQNPFAICTGPRVRVFLSPKYPRFAPRVLPGSVSVPRFCRHKKAGKTRPAQNACPPSGQAAPCLGECDGRCRGLPILFAPSIHRLPKPDVPYRQRATTRQIARPAKPWSGIRENSDSEASRRLTTSATSSSLTGR